MTNDMVITAFESIPMYSRDLPGRVPEPASPVET